MKETINERLKRIEGDATRLRHNVRRALKAMAAVAVLFALAFAGTGWQIDKAFEAVEEERISRIGGQSSINAYFCRKIDQVGDGVAVLVAASLRGTPPRSSLSEDQRDGLDRFTEYLDRQRRPPRCGRVALQLAILTGADPEDVVITPLRLEPRPAKSR